MRVDQCMSVLNQLTVANPIEETTFPRFWVQRARQVEAPRLGVRMMQFLPWWKSLYGAVIRSHSFFHLNFRIVISLPLAHSRTGHWTNNEHHRSPRRHLDIYYAKVRSYFRLRRPRPPGDLHLKRYDSSAVAPLLLSRSPKHERILLDDVHTIGAEFNFWMPRWYSIKIDYTPTRFGDCRWDGLFVPRVVHANVQHCWM